MGNNINQNYDEFFLLELLSNILQIASFQMLQKSTSNNDIMKELQVQDQTLSEQTNVYLKEIIKQNEEILELLKKYSFLIIRN